MEKYVMYVAVLLIAVLALTVWTNLVVQVTKKVVAWDKFPVQAYVAIVAIVSTVVAAAVAITYFKLTMHWYYAVAAVVVGLLVCYAAMYGYDNLYKQFAEMLQTIKKILAGNYETKDKVDTK
ncbi:hypothetical protein ACQRBN_06470 [Bariatricus sp. SGI.154]|uniref:hypothetical protein n=1 Tax=Bariatricus sp. SGI.154 TaxID=3420549 RepID=UPI003CFF837E